MRVIWSTELTDRHFDNYTIVSSVQELRALFEQEGNAEILIVHNLIGIKDAVVVYELAKLRDKVDVFAYVSEQPVPAVKSSLIGLGAKIFEDEFYFDSDEDLDALVEAASTYYDDSGESFSIVRSFVNSEVGVSGVLTPMQIEQINEAINSLEVALSDAETKLQSVNSFYLDFIVKVKSTLDAINFENNNLKVQLQELVNHRENTQSVRTTMATSMFYPSVPYTGTSKVLYIREVGNCRYLTSFLMAYMYHLNMVKNANAKLVILIPRATPALAKKYSDKFNKFTFIGDETKDSQGVADFYKRDKIVTNTPHKSVIHSILTSDCPYIIILDRLYRDSDFILDNRTSNVKKIYAVSGISDVSRYNLNLSTCIFPIVQVSGALMYIPHISNFLQTGQTVDSKYAKYMQSSVCLEGFATLDKLLLGGA